MRSAGIAYYYSSLITHVITGCGHDNIEIVVDLDYLSHVYVTTLFIRHFDIINTRVFRRKNVGESLMSCELHGSG